MEPGQDFDAYGEWLKVPAGKRPPDHYALLGLPMLGGTAEEIEQAAHEQLERLDQFAMHPDGWKRARCQALMNEVAQARTVLTDAGKRRAYDAALVGAPRPVAAARPKGREREAPQSGGGVSAGKWAGVVGVCGVIGVVAGLMAWRPWQGGKRAPGTEVARVEAPKPPVEQAVAERQEGVARAEPAATEAVVPVAREEKALGGLVHRWTFNDGTAKDVVGKADGVLSGGAAIEGGELVLGGRRGDEHVTLPTTGAGGIQVAEMQALTVQCWFTLGATDPRANLWSSLFSFGATAANGCGHHYLMGVARDGWSGGSTRAVISNNPPQKGPRFDPRAWECQAIGKRVIMDGKKHQFTLTVDGKGIAYYLDGELVDSAALQETGEGKVGLGSVSGEEAYIGDSVWRGDPSFWGRIDEVSMYARVLTGGEVAETYETGPVK